MRFMMTAAFVFAWAVVSQAELVRENIEYRQGDTICRGYIVYDEAALGKKPGILVVHEWWGLNDYAKQRADQLAQLGYIAMACDIFGGGKIAATTEEAQNLVKPFYADRALLRARVNAGFDVLRRHVMADSNRMGAMGFCFGGMTALELARSGAPLRGVVSFHGNLNTPNPDDAKNIKGAVLVLQGGNDPYVKDEEVVAFENEMRNAGVDWQVKIYGGAVHSFTNPAAGNDPSKGAAYNERATNRAWEAMSTFFTEVFR